MHDAARRSRYCKARRRRRSHLLCSLIAWTVVVAASLAITAATAPLIHSIVPATIPAAAIGPDRLPVTLTVYGTGFGASAAELMEVRVVREGISPQTSGVALTDAGAAALLAQASAMLPDSFACIAFLWLDSATVECTLPSLQLAANFVYSVQLNVSRALSTVAPGGSATLRMDCLASPLCGFCYLDQPASGEAFYFERQTSEQQSVEASILPRRLVLILLIIGAACACILLLLIPCGWRRLSRNSGGTGGGGKNRVGQRHSTGTGLGVIVSGSPISAPSESPPAPIPVPDGVMISYSHANSDFAHRLEAALTAAGMNVWIDTRIVPGEDWRANIAEAIELSFAVVIILSPQSVASRYCKEEIYYSAQLNRHLVPIVYEDSWKALKGGLKMLLQRIQWIDFARDGWDNCFPRLVSNLQTAHKALQDRAAAVAAEDAAARGWGAASGAGGILPTGLRSVTAAHHRLRPAQLELEAGGVGGDDHDLDYEDTASYRAAAGGGDDTLVMMSPRQSNQTQQQNLPVLRLRLPELAGEEVSHEASQSDPADVYICVDGSSRTDQSIAECLRAYLVSHGIQVYTSSHPKMHVKAIKGARGGQMQHVLINSDGRASPVLVTRPQSAAGLASINHRASPDHSRRPSVIAAHAAAHAAAQAAAQGAGASTHSGVATPGLDVRSPEPAEYLGSEFLSPLSAASVGSPDSAPISASAWGPQHSPDSGGGVGSPTPAPAAVRTLGLNSLRGGASGSSAGIAGTTSPPVNPALEHVALSSVSHKRARSLFSDGGSFVDSLGATEDLFELNASHIDASTMMMFIASASSIKSNDCIDELHYSYEVSKPMLAIRNVPPLEAEGGSGGSMAAANRWHQGLMHGSVGMMLNQAPSVSWETDGQSTVEWTALFFAIKHKLQAERMRKRLDNSRKSGGAAVLNSPAAKAALASLATADADAAKQPSQPTQIPPSTTASTTTTLCVPPMLDAGSSGGPSPPTSARGVLLGVMSPTARRSSRTGGGVELAPLNVTSPIAITPSGTLASSGGGGGGGSGAFQSLRSDVLIETHSPAAASSPAASPGDGTMVAASASPPCASPVYSSGSPPLHPGDPAALLPLPPSTSPVAPSASAVLPMSPQPSGSPPAPAQGTSSPSPPSLPLHHAVTPSTSPMLPVKHHRSPSSRVPADSPIRMQNAAAAAAGPSTSASSGSSSPVAGMEHSFSPLPAASGVRVIMSGASPMGPSTPRPIFPAASAGSGSSSSHFAALAKVPTAVTGAATPAASSSARVKIVAKKPPATGRRASGTAAVPARPDDAAAVEATATDATN